MVLNREIFQVIILMLMQKLIKIIIYTIKKLKMIQIKKLIFSKKTENNILIL